MATFWAVLFLNRDLKKKKTQNPNMRNWDVIIRHPPCSLPNLVSWWPISPVTPPIPHLIMKQIQVIMFICRYFRMPFVFYSCIVFHWVNKSPRDSTYVSGLPWWLSGKEPTWQETWVWSLGQEDPLEEEVVTHSSILAWEIPRTEGAWKAIVHGVAKESDTT